MTQATSRRAADEPTKLPVIDLSAADDPARADAFHHDLHAAAHEVGFFQLVGHGIGPEQADELLGSAAGLHVDQMLKYAAVGPPAEVSEYLDDFRKQTEADELITVHQSPSLDGRLRSVTLLAEAMQTVSA